MTVTVEVADVSGCKVVRLSGHVDHALAARLGEGLSEVCRAMLDGPIVVDLSGVAVVDMELAAALTEKLEEPVLAGHVLLVSPRLAARRILRHSCGTVRIFPSVDDAIRARNAVNQ